MSSRCAREGAAIPMDRALLLLALALGWPAVGRAADDEAYRLKPGAKGRVCLTCHSEFAEVLGRPSVHTPVKAGDCSDCHDPHAADHADLLADAPEKVCLACHGGVVPAGAKSVHRVVGEGACARCHDPHASGHPNQLLKAGADLCLGCHGDVGKAIETARFRHAPVSRGCLACHDPHASGTAPFLLKKSVPGLCVACHRTDLPAFTAAHLGYPVGKSNCGSCHDPHGSSVPGILRANPHAPMAGETCDACHPGPDAAAPLATKRQGVDLCRDCHSDVLDEALSRNRIHWPVVDRRGCLNCHEPHAARVPGLLSGAPGDLCGGCHRDAVERQAKSRVKHPPVQKGECGACHEPHAGNEVHLLTKPEGELCGACHDWARHSAHPMGAKAIDPRDRNLEVGCGSCHRSHGTPFKALSHFDPDRELCVQCHEGLKR